MVYSAKDPRIKRQYTICSSMDPEIKERLIELVYSVVEKNEIEFDYRMLLGIDQSSINLTLKTYGKARGLATRIHNTSVGIKEIKDS